MEAPRHTMYESTNPFTGQRQHSYPTATDVEVGATMTQLHEGYLMWRDQPLDHRAAVLERAAQAFEEHQAELGAIATSEMGKRVAECESELHTTASIWRYYARNAARLLEAETISARAGEALLEKLPTGVILGVMPWNYPYYQVARFAAPNLALGNTVLLKHSPVCPGVALAIEKLLRGAGVPADAYRNIFASDEQVASLIADPRVRGVSFTGSERAGTAVAEVAGRCLKKVVLELGGSDPMVVLDADDLGVVIDTAARARMSNMGQACNSPKRMIVSEHLYARFVDGLIDRWRTHRPGDPADPATTLAPLSSRGAASAVLAQVGGAVRQGARLRFGGGALEGPAAFVQPTVLTGVSSNLEIHHQEVFGPVAVVYCAADEDQAVAMANDTPFGLGASVFSPDEQRARRVGARLDVGMVFINQAADSEAELPFGGVKRSGLGRELGALGIREFMNQQLVRI